MPAPGDQHNNHAGQPIINPFEEVKPRISEYTAQEIASLQSRLEKQLGPEYISSRSGPSGQKVHYLAAEKCIQLANEVFGFNGWSSQIMTLQVDFVDENPTTLKVSLGLSVIVRVTLRDGTFHEDIGYGHIENCKGKAAAFEKAKKEGTTDGLKRALRNFGNVLGNCIYDKEYLAKVTKVKVAPTKWDIDGLHRHSTYAPVATIKKEIDAPAQHDMKQTRSAEANSPNTLEDEFGDIDFDEADFGVSHDPDSHPDEVVLHMAATSHHSGGGVSSNNSIPALGQVQGSGAPNQLGPPASRMPAPARPPFVVQGHENKAGPPLQVQHNKPQTPNSGFMRSNSSSGSSAMHPQQDGITARAPLQGPAPQIGRVLNQPSRTSATNSAPTSPAKQQRPTSSTDESLRLGPPPNLGSTGFFSARAATALVGDDDGPPLAPPESLPAFNPLAESPSIRKTPGVDHTKTRPTTRDLKHIPGTTDATDGEMAPSMRSNIINPQLSTARRIGAPGSPSPLANKGAYKPPTMKRPSDAVTSLRPPLHNMTTNGIQSAADDGGEMKRQKMSGPN